MSNLTPKQELFAQEYVKTGNASQAYRIAYPASTKWKDKSVWEKSSTLMSDVKVKSRVQELQRQSEEKHSISKDKILNRLQQIIFDQDTIHDGKIDLSAINKAVDTLNKMMGYYEPEKTDNKITIEMKTRF